MRGPATDRSSALDITYQYDVRGQLLEENRKDAVFRYSYDAAGNRIRKEEETGKDQRIRTEYAYNEKNQLIHTEEFLSDRILRRNTFTYSKQGSILKEETESGISQYFYNGKNQQIRVECADGQIQENRYDAEGLRHEMRENEKLLRFVYQNGELLYEEGGDKETASCHLGAGIEAVRRGQRTYYYHPDEQLSTALITDETGMIKNQYRYDAFGAGLEVSEELPNRIRYTGQRYDGVTEQYYLRARYYNPILGRFLQEDVYQGDGLNLYAYCRNNPVVYYDPSGYGRREEYVGSTLKMNSPGGREVLDRMLLEGRIDINGISDVNIKGLIERDGFKTARIKITKGLKDEVLFYSNDDKSWHKLSEGNMGHIVNAVDAWNEKYYKYGKKSEKVREFMKDPNNYEIQTEHANKSAGAKLGTYRDPEEPNNETITASTCP